MLILGYQKTTLLDYPHHTASTIFTGGCNFRCPYCHNKDLVISPDTTNAIPFLEILQHLNKRKNILDGVCITGGEPTLQPDLIDCIKEIKALNLLVKLDTNGTKPALLEKLINEQLIDYVAMDIKTSLEKYNEVACMNGFNPSGISTSVDILKNSNIDYEFRTTVANELHDIQTMQSIAQWLEGAKAYYLQPYKESDQVISPIFSTPTTATLTSYIEIIRPYIPTVELRGVD